MGERWGQHLLQAQNEMWRYGFVLFNPWVTNAVPFIQFQMIAAFTFTFGQAKQSGRSVVKSETIFYYL